MVSSQWPVYLNSPKLLTVSGTASWCSGRHQSVLNKKETVTVKESQINIGQTVVLKAYLKYV